MPRVSDPTNDQPKGTITQANNRVYSSRANFFRSRPFIMVRLLRNLGDGTVKNKFRILIDLDCVLADFLGGVCRLWGFTLADVQKHWQRGTYGVTEPLGKALTARTGSPAMMDDKTFWGAIEDVPGFWEDLEEFPWTRHLLDLIRSATDDWYVVSAPSRCPRCIPEKREWLHRVLDVEWYDRLIPTPHKELMAKPGVVLIDDYDRNCKAFNMEGGFAITFPSYHNSMNHYEQTPMAFVQASLESYQRRL